MSAGGEMRSWAVEALSLASLEERPLSVESGEECSASVCKVVCFFGGGISSIELKLPVFN